MLEFIIYNYRFKKIANAAWKTKMLNSFFLYKYFLGKKIAKTIKLYKDKPNCLRVENTNICNADCFLCSRGLMKRRQGIMDNALFEQIAMQCREYNINKINLHNFGEPLIDNKFSEKVSIAKKYGIGKVTTNTNASLLTEEVGRQLLAVGLDELFVSIDAASEGTYKKVRDGLEYNQVVDNLLKFIAIKRKSGANTKLILSFVLNAFNKMEVDDFIKFWHNKCDFISISYPHNWLGSSSIIFDNNRLSQPCKLLFSDLTITWNGDYILCCADFDAKVILGNFKNSDILTVWQKNEILNKYRLAHLKDYSFNLSPCKECTLNTVWWL